MLPENRLSRSERSLLPPVRLEPDGARFRPLCRTADYKAALVHYPADVHHPRHEHDKAQLTFLLCGGFVDDWEGRETCPSGSRHGFRPQGVRHSCRFGHNGALILSVSFRADVPLPPAPHQWQPSGPALARLYALLFGRIAPAAMVIDDLIAAASNPGDGRRTGNFGAPRWLRLAAEELADDPTAEIAEVASRAGVHRVYLSRAFQRHFGLTPSQFRLHCKSALALRHMIEGGQSPCMAAASAGFADQAHWTRASRAAAGITPARLRHMLAA
jgi:AraC family transcriptional regulator